MQITKLQTKFDRKTLSYSGKNHLNLFTNLHARMLKQRENPIIRRFNVTADLNLMRMLSKNLTDATHTDDLGYLFQ